MNLREVWLTYRWELRSALRERSIVVHTFLIPALLYPFILWAVLMGVTVSMGISERFPSRVALLNLPSQAGAFGKILETDKSIDVVATISSAEEARSKIADGSLDLLVEFAGAPGEGNFGVTLWRDATRSRGNQALERVQSQLAEWRLRRGREISRELGIGPEAWNPFQIRTRDEASSVQRGQMILGMMLPIFLLMMTAQGCFYPAIDTTAGEKERSTWETLMTVSARRASLIGGKYLYIATLGVIAGLVNLAAMVFSLKGLFGAIPGAGTAGLQIQLPWSALPVLAIGVVLFALLVAAGMMAFALFARNFKEGQSMVSPFYLLISMPILLLQSPDIEFTARLALIPVVNTAMMFRQAINGQFHWPLFALALAAQAGLIAACLWGAQWLLRHEEIVSGDFKGSLFKFIRAKSKARKKRSAA